MVLAYGRSGQSSALVTQRWQQELKLVKLADKICNLRDVAASPPANWPVARQQEYFDWARSVVDGLRGTHPGLEHLFDQAYESRP